MNNEVSNKVVGYEVEKITPEDQLRGCVKAWDCLDCKPVTNDLVRDAATIALDIYRLCERYNWQLPVLKRYDFYVPFSNL